MAAATENMIFKFLAGKDTALPKLEQIEKQISQVGALSAKGFINTKNSKRAVDRLSKSFPELEKNIKQTFKTGQRQGQGFDATFLSLIFSGMALTRTFGSVFRMMSNVGGRLEETTSKGHQEFTNLSASVQFFKFSLFDAFTNTGIFSSFVSSAISAMRRVTKIFQDEGTAELALTISSVGFIAGAGLGATGLLAQIGQLMKTTAPGLFTGGQISTGVLGVSVAIGAAMTLVDIGQLAGAISSGDVSDIFNEIMDVIGSAMITAGAVTATHNPMLGGILITSGLFIRFIPEIWSAMKENPDEVAKSVDKVSENLFGMGTSFGDAFSDDKQQKITDTDEKTNFLKQTVETMKDIVFPDLITRNQEVTESYRDMAEAAREAAEEQSKIGTNDSVGSFFNSPTSTSSITLDR